MVIILDKRVSMGYDTYMEIEIVHYLILDDDERKLVRTAMTRCRPLSLTEPQGKLRNRLMEDRKFTSGLVTQSVVPYLEWLLGHYQQELMNAEQQKNSADTNAVVVWSLVEFGSSSQWAVLADVRREMIALVRDVLSIFQAGLSRLKGLPKIQASVSETTQTASGTAGEWPGERSGRVTKQIASVDASVKG